MDVTPLKSASLIVAQHPEQGGDHPKDPSANANAGDLSPGGSSVRGRAAKVEGLANVGPQGSHRRPVSEVIPGWDRNRLACVCVRSRAFHAFIVLHSS